MYICIKYLKNDILFLFAGVIKVFCIVALYVKLFHLTIAMWGICKNYLKLIKFIRMGPAVW